MSDAQSREGPQLQRLHRYIKELPDGLDSYPECLAKASVHRRVLAYSNLELSGLPTALQALVDEPPPANTWIPQCHALALIVAAVEQQQLEPAEERTWIEGAAAHVFSSPMYRILMWAATPRLLFKGAHLRWSAFFRGSALHATVERNHADLLLECPGALFTPDVANIFEHVLRAAANFTEEGRGMIELEQFAPGAIIYRGWW